MAKGQKVGCYIDGSSGHANSRIRLAMLLEAHAWAESEVGRTERAKYMRETAADLRAPMTDDAYEEHQASIWLDEVAGRPDAYWGWQGGDFGLWSVDSGDSGKAEGK